MNPDYDPDWPSPEELQAMTPRYTPRDRRRDVLLFCIVYALLVLMAILNGGCATDPATGDLTVRVPAAAVDAATNAAARAVVAIREAREKPEAPEAPEAPDATGAPDAATPEPSQPSQPSPAPVLVFRYGGFDGSRAAEDPRCRISKLRIGKDSLSFHWDTGIPSDWPRGDTKKGPMILACAFYEEGGRWIGGKFDWVDEHRSSRPLENVHDGYNGWDAAAWKAAKKHAFCVVSADGKFRSNLLAD